MIDQLTLPGLSLLGLALLVFGLVPGILMRLLVMCWPKDSPRRPELIAEYRVLKRRDRPWFVAELVEGALFDGLPLRRADRQARNRATRDANGWLGQALLQQLQAVGLALWLAIASLGGAVAASIALILGETRGLQIQILAVASALAALSMALLLVVTSHRPRRRRGLIRRT